MRRFIGGTTASVLLLGAIFLLGPRVDLADDYEPFDAAMDVASWVSDRATEFEDIVPGTEHRLIWDGEQGTRTRWSIVYLHGFSGSSAMAYPFVDSMAARLGANAYLPRLAGHGRSSEALGEAQLSDWVQDTADAVAIGRLLGEKTLLVGLSTGGTMAYWASGHPLLGQDIDALVLLSPNFRPRDEKSEMLLWPWGRQIASAVLGDTHHWESYSESHDRFTTNDYPTTVFPQMMGTVALTRRIDPISVDLPLLILYSESDLVVSAQVTREVAAALSPAPRMVDVGGVGDPNDHVIVGDALSPGNTMPTLAHVMEFVHRLETGESR